jgi:hypothetical protein
MHKVDMLVGEEGGHSALAAEPLVASPVFPARDTLVRRLRPALESAPSLPTGAKTARLDPFKILTRALVMIDFMLHARGI